MTRKDDKLRKAIGNRLRAARRTKGLTGDQVATAIGVSRGMVAQWESGQAFPFPENLVQILSNLKVSADWVLNVNWPDNISSDRKEAMRILDQLSEDQLPVAQRLLSVAGGYSGELG